MDDVIENCQTTFEEDGVTQQTLEDLRQVGCREAFSPAFLSSASLCRGSTKNLSYRYSIIMKIFAFLMCATSCVDGAGVLHLVALSLPKSWGEDRAI